ncbi:MAG TPA: hypothetical protein VM580_15495, partial [Labilithrix sp.]|nr:hypothetical protein [Labilithrix sp.]
LSYRLPSKSRDAGAELRGRLQSLGILRESGHEHMTGSLVVPIFDEAVGVRSVGGRPVAALTNGRETRSNVDSESVSGGSTQYGAASMNASYVRAV